MPDFALEEDNKVLTMPDPENTEAIEQFIADELTPIHDKRGVKTLTRSLQRFMRIRHYADKHLERALKNLETVNGVRTTNQKGGDKVRSLRHTAEKFYSLQNTTGLRQHCTLFGLDYDSYMTSDDVIAALVEHHVAMQQNELVSG